MAVERGQASLLTIALIGLTFVVAMGLAHVGEAALDAARAQTAADAAALAGAATGADSDVHETAGRNGGEVASIRRSDLSVTVAVRVGRAERWARATLLLVPE